MPLQPPPKNGEAPGPIASSERLSKEPLPGVPISDPNEGEGSIGVKGNAAREIPRLTEELGRPVNVVSVQVIDPTGRPLNGVLVKLGDRETVTDSQGEAVLPRKDSDLDLRHPDFLPRSIDPELRRGISIPDQESSCERLVLVLFPGGHIAGQVLDASGRPVPRAQVAFDWEEGAAVSTDDRGEFRSPILRPGIHRFFVHHPDFQGTDGTATVPSGGGEVRAAVILRSGVPLEIRTVQASGAPIPDAGVWIIRKKPGYAEETRFAGRTGDDGSLAIRWDPSDPHDLRVLVPGFREEVLPISGTRTTVTLERAPLVSGQVLEKERGLPVKPAEIILEIETKDGFGRAPDRGVLFRTLAAGKFRVGLPPFPGIYRIRALAEGDLSGTSERIDFNGRSDPPPVMVYLDLRTSLRGQVLASGPEGEAGPIAGGRVELYRHDFSEALRPAYGIWFAAPPVPVRVVSTDAGGSFTLKDLKPAAYRIRVAHPDFAVWVSAPINVPLDVPLTCFLRKGSALRGTVFSSKGTPEPGIPMILAPQGNPFTAFTRSDESGRYEYRNLAEGSYSLFTGDLRAEGSMGIQTRWASPPLHPGRDEKNRISIRAGQDLIFDVHREDRELGGLSGKVSTDGKPLKNVPLRVIPSSTDGESEGTPEGLVARNGLDAIQPSSLAESGEARPIQDLEGKGEEGDTAERLPPRGEGRGDGVANDREAAPEPEFEITTGPDGEFSLEGLEPGHYRISGDGLPERTIEVARGRTTNLEIGLKTLAYTASLIDGLKGTPIRSNGAAEIAPEGGVGGPGNESPPSGSLRTFPIEGGRISAPGLLPGRYRIRVKVPGYLDYAGGFVLKADSPGGGLAAEIRLRPGNTLRIALLDADDRPFQGTAEAVLLKDGVEIHRSYGPVDGAVLLPVLPAGTYTLTIRNEDGSTRMQLEVFEDAEVRARLGKGRR